MTRNRMPPPPDKLPWYYEGALDESSDRNIGGSAPIPNNTVDGTRGDPVELVRVFGSDQRSRQITVDVYQHLPQVDGNPTAKGPFLAVVEWAAGGANFSAISVDVPTPTTIEPQFNGSAAGTGLKPPNANPNGFALSVAAAGVRVFIRDMSREITIVGNQPGPPVAGDRLGFTIGVAVESEISAFVGYQPAPNISRNLRRRILIANQGGTAWAIDQTLIVNIPAYAKRVRFPRAPLGSIEVTLIDGTALASSGPDIVPVSSAGVIELGPQDIALQIKNVSAAPIVAAAADFDLEI